MDRVQLVNVSDSPEHVGEVRMMFRVYAAELGVNLNFQGFEEELADLPGCYSAPRGTVLIALVDDVTAGCVALRPFDRETAELKRLYVRPEFRRQKLAQVLVNEVLGFAFEAGYRRVLLDTLASMTAARKLYEEFGFQQTAPYYQNPLPDVIYYQLDFHADARARVAKRALELGTGKWAVTVANDNETTTEEVIELILDHCPYDEELATALMNLAHFHGSAIVRRLPTREHALDLQTAMIRDCRSRGMPLDVGLYEIPADRLGPPPPSGVA